MAKRQARLGGSAPAVRVVAHRPWRRGLIIFAVVATTLAGSLAGFQLGRSVGELDRLYVDSLERLNSANAATVGVLEARLVEAELTRGVDQEAAGELRGTIRELKDEVASLEEEVTFYKSLMAPSSLARGLQIADFELEPMDRDGRYTFHLLLTQVETRRDWVQGDATLEVHGRMTGSENATPEADRVLNLTEIGEEGTYPLKFRFRYFQDLTGVINLPSGFTPDRIVVTAGKSGAGSDNLSRTFEWTVAG
jgi:hypothetical protein